MSEKRFLSRDFWKLLIVCLKMLFRKTTRTRFICLVAVFLFIMGLNTNSYIRKFRDAEIRKREVLEEKAFKVFFLRFRTQNDHARFVRHSGNGSALPATAVVNRAFIYQNNLYIHCAGPWERGGNSRGTEGEAMELLYELFGITGAVERFFSGAEPVGYTVKIHNHYVDHNGDGLDPDIVAGRYIGLKGDLRDAADLIRGDMAGGRLSVFNDLTGRVINGMERETGDSGGAPNAYLSRVELIVPLNLLHLFKNLREDNTTDIVDFALAVAWRNPPQFEADRVYLEIPEPYRTAMMYGDIDLYPRYVALYIPELLAARWRWLLFEDIRIDHGVMDALETQHFNGHYLFSFEKTRMILSKVRKINEDIRFNHIHFYLTDLSMGIAFPFMISLFSFIHLKSEFAFLLMFKNRIRELLAIFWLIPLFLMITLKGGIAAVYLVHSPGAGFGTLFPWMLLLPMTLSFLTVAAVFYPVNRWCFAQLTGSRLNLAALHKGR